MANNEDFEPLIDPKKLADAWRKHEMRKLRNSFRDGGIDKSTKRLLSSQIERSYQRALRSLSSPPLYGHPPTQVMSVWDIGKDVRKVIYSMGGSVPSVSSLCLTDHVAAIGSQTVKRTVVHRLLRAELIVESHRDMTCQLFCLSAKGLSLCVKLRRITQAIYLLGGDALNVVLDHSQSEWQSWKKQVVEHRLPEAREW